MLGTQAAIREYANAAPNQVGWAMNAIIIKSGAQGGAGLVKEDAELLTGGANLSRIFNFSSAARKAYWAAKFLLAIVPDAAEMFYSCGQ